MLSGSFNVDLHIIDLLKVHKKDSIYAKICWKFTKKYIETLYLKLQN